MKRRSFITKSASVGLLVGTTWSYGQDKIPPHNWDGYDFGPPPSIKNRLNQGPFSNYGPGATAPGADVVMVTTPSNKPVRNFGMGMVTYICDEVGPPKVEGETLRESIEKLAKFPLGDILYIRVDWRDIQKEPKKLDFPEHWDLTFEMAKKYGKRVAFRIQLMSPVIEPESMPDFLIGKVPLVKLGTTDEIGIPGKVHYAPQYDHPEFMKAFKDMDDLLSTIYNGHELVEYVDTCMYGFWGEGHTWPFNGNPFPDYHTAEKTCIEMFEHQIANWTKTPLVTNTQPDYSNVGNSEILDRTIRSYNWLRTDTIFIETSQIDALSNRPPWIGATIEQGLRTEQVNNKTAFEGITRNENIIAHIKDVSPTYYSLWNWHNISFENLLGYYGKHPEPLDGLAANIGYRIRPSWIWCFEKDGYPGLILGLVNDGISGVPGALCISIVDEAGNMVSSGSMDPGYPLPGKVRQASFTFPKDTLWDTLSLKAEIEVKGVKYAIKWACSQELENDGTLRLKRNL
ncbi:hypothetical protein [Flagellimonas eckloniae]|uniref:DUF4832 domain-containing protein n=1 Tax=Flagellimonas eckloniae TaxID=346185 RepID=A0A0Q0WZ55_9FLAO|nr:hypothetical protein [Allomuricauda eckloniae]KQC30728.1 hypothetical protein AAY42_13185 [Allomuricauda eckloniae]